MISDMRLLQVSDQYRTVNVRTAQDWALCGLLC